MKKTVLIIDDFENSLFVTGMTIERAGYNVIKANSGTEALKTIKSEIHLDLIISDYHMPNMNGLALVLEIKKLPHRTRVPIFMLSTEAKEEIKKPVMQAGASLWIQKPFKTEKLVEYVKRAIG